MFTVNFWRSFLNLELGGMITKFEGRKESRCFSQRLAWGGGVFKWVTGKAQADRGTSIYTPGLVTPGQEWRDQRHRDPQAQLQIGRAFRRWRKSDRLGRGVRDPSTGTGPQAKSPHRDSRPRAGLQVDGRTRIDPWPPRRSSTCCDGPCIMYNLSRYENIHPQVRERKLSSIE